jgi:glutamyl/glutaminyl-tRNA synthetase
MKTGDQKLSKSDGDTGVRALAAAGWTRDRILAEAVRLPAVQVARENDPQ